MPPMTCFWKIPPWQMEGYPQKVPPAEFGFYGSAIDHKRQEVICFQWIGLDGGILLDVLGWVNGGEGGIRTPDSLTTMPDFESGAFNRALPPLRSLILCIY